MFAEFGQAPLCLDIHLDTYEDSPTHVASFRGRSGWLRLARATLQSEHDLLQSDLIVACTDDGIPIPAWRARHLTQCHWSGMEPCMEHPPDLLDDLLAEEEGALYARWQRDMNGDLATLFEQSQIEIDALESRVRARSRELERQVADLRRRRRMPGIDTDARIALGEVIAELEAENDLVLAQFTEQQARLRYEAQAAEEALWQRTDLLVEVEHSFTVQWTASGLFSRRERDRVWRAGRFWAAPTSDAINERPAPDEHLLGALQRVPEPSYHMGRKERAAALEAAYFGRSARMIKARAKPKPTAGQDKVAPSGELPEGARRVMRELAQALAHNVARKAEAGEDQTETARAQTPPANPHRLNVALIVERARERSRLKEEQAAAAPLPFITQRILANVQRRRAKIAAQVDVHRLAFERPDLNPVQRARQLGKLEWWQRQLDDIDQRIAAEYSPAPAPVPEPEPEAAFPFAPGETASETAPLHASAPAPAANSTPSPARTGWTSAEIEMLRCLWEAGVPPAEIARQLGNGITANAVIGRAHRMGLKAGLQP
jgi:hypothetical protein